MGDVQVVCWEIYSFMGGVLFFPFLLFVHFLPLYTSRGQRKCVGEDSDVDICFFLKKKVMHPSSSTIIFGGWLVRKQAKGRDVGKLCYRCPPW